VKDYESWSFRDRSFGFALFLSLSWHLFWFFSISIVVTSPKKMAKSRPVILSLGPVLDDSIFKTLAATKPQLSETFYRHLSDFAAPAEIEVKTVERHSPGDVVSVPFGRRVGSFLRELISGEKSSPDYEIAARIPIDYASANENLEGDIRLRAVLSKPDEPQISQDLLRRIESSDMEIDFLVSAAGIVTKAEIVRSSGDSKVDVLWLDYLKQWKFSTLGFDRPALEQSGRVKFRIGFHGSKED